MPEWSDDGAVSGHILMVPFLMLDYNRQYLRTPEHLDSVSVRYTRRKLLVGESESTSTITACLLFAGDAKDCNATNCRIESHYLT